MQIEDIVTSIPVLPVLTIERLDDAVPLARALVAGGIEVLEISLGTPAALAAVEAVAGALPDAIVGVGMLTRPEQFVHATDAGARFAVSPGLTRVLLNASAESELPFLPGVFSPSEAMAARDVGFEYLKLFPAAQAGGLGMLRVLGGAFPELRFCPTGGIGADDYRAYLALPNVVCVGGAWLTPHEVVEAGDWDTVTRLARQASR